MGRKDTIVGNTDNYKVFMFFIEPNYDNKYTKSFNLVHYTNADPNTGSFRLIESRNNNLDDIDSQIQRMEIYRQRLK